MAFFIHFMETLIKQFIIVWLFNAASDSLMWHIIFQVVLRCGIEMKRPAVHYYVISHGICQLSTF